MDHVRDFVSAPSASQEDTWEWLCPTFCDCLCDTDVLRVLEHEYPIASERTLLAPAQRAHLEGRSIMTKHSRGDMSHELREAGASRVLPTLCRKRTFRAGREGVMSPSDILQQFRRHS